MEQDRLSEFENGRFYGFLNAINNMEFENVYLTLEIDDSNYFPEFCIYNGTKKIMSSTDCETLYMMLQGLFAGMMLIKK